MKELRSGEPRARVAVSMAMGVVAAAYPQIACSTLMGGLLGLVFRLNHVALQAMRWPLSPIQWFLMIPFLRIGEFLVGADPLMMSVVEIFEVVLSDPIGSFSVLGIPLLHAILGWFVICALSFPALYYICARSLDRLAPVLKIESDTTVNDA